MQVTESARPRIRIRWHAQLRPAICLIRVTAALSSPSPGYSVRATQLMINDRWVAADSGKTFATVNPATGEEIARVSEAGPSDVDRAVAAARSAFELGTWRRWSGEERGKRLNR